MAREDLIRVRGITLELDAEVYRPAEDSLLLLSAIESLSDLSGLRCLDVGTGTGILAIKMALLGCDTVASDISDRAVRLALRNAHTNGVEIHVVQGNLSHHFREHSFDLVVFNPPYLPEEPDPTIELSISWSGGARGRKLIEGLLKDLPRILKERGRALILHASYNNPELTLKRVSKLGLKGEIIGRRKLPFHELLVVEIKSVRVERP